MRVPHRRLVVLLFLDKDVRMGRSLPRFGKDAEHPFGGVREFGSAYKRTEIGRCRG